MQPLIPGGGILAGNGVIDAVQAANVPTVLSEMIAYDWDVASHWHRDVVTRVKSLLETVVGFQWGVGRGPEIVAAGHSWYDLNDQILSRANTVQADTIRNFLAAYATVSDSRGQLELLSENSSPQDPLFAELSASPLIDKSWLYGLRIKASLELEAALNQIELSSSYSGDINKVGRVGTYGSDLVGQLISLNEDRMGREILNHVGEPMVRPTADGLPSMGDITRAHEFGTYFAKIRSLSGNADGAVAQLLDQSVITTMSDILFGQNAAPRRLIATDHAAYFREASRTFDMTAAYSTEFGEDYRWAFTVTAMRELEQIDRTGRNLIAALGKSLDQANLTQTAAELQALVDAARNVLFVIDDLDSDGALGGAPVVQRWKNVSISDDVGSLLMTSGVGDDSGCHVFGVNLPLVKALADPEIYTSMVENGCSPSRDALPDQE